jgi:hypothetical protein
VLPAYTLLIASSVVILPTLILSQNGSNTRSNIERSMRESSQSCACTPQGHASLKGVHLTDVHLIGIYLTGMHLTSGHLISVSLTLPTPRAEISKL